MADEIRFDGRVAIVTGAGGGLGRAHALLLASRGAKVVVNDLGGAIDGTGGSQTAAQKVVDEIKAAGGEAVASYDGVHTTEGAQNIVKTAVSTFGTLDIVINNAGILRDVSLMKMTEEDWNKVIGVHLTGGYNVTKAAFPTLREKGYGRIVFTSSAAGLYGNFGQCNYSAAKLGLVGLCNSVEEEGRKYNIFANCIAPVAVTRMTETLPGFSAMGDKLKPEQVAPLVAYLCSDKCKVSGEVFAVGGGYLSRVAIVEAAGVFLDQTTIESVAANLESARDLSKARPFGNAMEAAGAMMQKAMTR
ncbi:MAG: SDR family oxidoreductase [Deltaproteobacteria bacterium]|nr:SDR family oxidoreductase [Deltaproteobacteria bacterium]